MKALEKDGYLYDPPSWRVCPKCGGKRFIFNGQMSPTTIPCPKCAASPKPGYLPVRHTPKEWVDAKGVLTDNTPVWIQAKNGQWMEGLYWEHDENSHSTPLVIATSAGPPEDCMSVTKEQIEWAMEPLGFDHSEGVDKITYMEAAYREAIEKLEDISSRIMVESYNNRIDHKWAKNAMKSIDRVLDKYPGEK